MSRPVTIHSDGTGRGTVVLDEDGKQIANISSLSMYVSANGVMEATIELTHTASVIQAHVTEVQWVCPLCHTCETHECDTQLGDPSACDHPTMTLAGKCESCGKQVR